MPHDTGDTGEAGEVGYDVLLHVMDRQIVDADGRMVAKVDDVELTVAADGKLRPSALLVGMTVLLPRFGRRLGTMLHRTQLLLHETAADRDLPLVVELDLVEEVGSGIRLRRPRHALLERMDRARAEDPRRRRVGALVGMPVRCAALPRDSRVLDVRVAGRLDGPGRHEVSALIVGPGRPGALLGYDRRTEPGPWLVARVVARLHRHARVVDLGREVAVDWEAGEVRIGAGASLRPLVG